jgi:S1-C subfamily serine protease
MSIRVRCSACGHSFKADAKYKGKRARCPKCGNLLRVVDHRSEDDAYPPGAKKESEDTARVLAEDRTKRSCSDDTQMPQGRTLDWGPAGDEFDDGPNLVSVFGDAETGANPTVAVGRPMPAPGEAPHVGQPAPAGAAEAPAINVGDSQATSAAARLTSQSKPSKPLSPIVLVGGIGVALLFVLGLGGGAGVFFLLSSGDDFGGRQVDGDGESTTPETEVEEGVASLEESGADSDEAPSEPASDSSEQNTTSSTTSTDVARRLSSLASRSVAKLHVRKASGDTTGSAFFVSADGWLATSHRLIDGALEVGVELEDMIGATIESEGIVRVDRQHDLALISVHPRRRFNVAPLGRNASLSPGDKQFAAALPASGDQWVSPCRVLGRRSTSELPREVVAPFGDVSLAPDMVWLELDAKIAPEGMGGPLFDPGGEVHGVCLATDGTGGRVFAVDVRHLASLLDAAESSELNLTAYGAPPSTVAFSTDDDGEAPIDLPSSPTTQRPSSDPPASEKAEAFTQQLADTLADLKKKCAAAEWLPRTGEEYADFQQLAVELTTAAALADEPKVPEEIRARLSGAISDALVPEIQWENIPRFDAVNRLAAAGMENGSKSRGVYAFGEVVARPGRITLNRQPAVGLQLPGTDEVVFTPIRFHAEAFQPGTRWLILGVYRGRINELSDDTRRCSVIDARYVVGVPESD